MKKFFKSRNFKILLSVSAALLICILIAAASARHSSPLSAAAGTLMKPFESAASFLGKGFSKAKAFLKAPEKYEAEIRKLEKEKAKYQAELADYEKTKKKLLLYEEFLEIKKEHDDYKVAPASIIGRDSADAFSALLLNRGSSDGISVNDPVLYGDGRLIGVVTKTAPTYCVVSTLLDPKVSVSAYELRTGETGFVLNTAGLAKKGLCRLSGLERTTAVGSGGIVCTSGVGGVYPRDLIIGTVKEVRNDDKDISSYAVIVPGIDTDKLEDVLILTEFRGQGVNAVLAREAEAAEK